jgi:hypothetical protein
MEILISVLAGIGALAIVTAAYIVYSWLRNVRRKLDSHEAWFEVQDERLDNFRDRFYKVDGKMEDLEDRVDGLEHLTSENILDKIKKK